MRVGTGGPNGEQEYEVGNIGDTAEIKGRFKGTMET